MRSYTPCDLPPLPRLHCPFECRKTVQRYGSKADLYIVKTPCTGKPLANGWCAWHQSSQELLDWGAQIGYPRLQVNSALWITGGIANWEDYAVCYPASRREQITWAIENYSTSERKQARYGHRNT